jgi:hypothetical protein
MFVSPDRGLRRELRMCGLGMPLEPLEPVQPVHRHNPISIMFQTWHIEIAWGAP